MLGCEPDQTSSASTTLSPSSPTHLPFSHLLSLLQAAPWLPAALSLLAWEEAQKGGLSQRRKPAGPWGCLFWMGGVSVQLTMKAGSPVEAEA